MYISLTLHCSYKTLFTLACRLYQDWNNASQSPLSNRQELTNSSLTHLFQCAHICHDCSIYCHILLVTFNYIINLCSIPRSGCTWIGISVSALLMPGIVSGVQEIVYISKMFIWWYSIQKVSRSETSLVKFRKATLYGILLWYLYFTLFSKESSNYWQLVMVWFGFYSHI